MNPTEAAAPLPAPGGGPEPQGAPASAQDGGTNAFAAIFATLAGLGPPPTAGPQAEALTAHAEGTEAGSDSPGQNAGSDGSLALTGTSLLEGQLAASMLVGAMPAASMPAAPASAGTVQAGTVPAGSLHAGPLLVAAEPVVASSVPANPAPANPGPAGQAIPDAGPPAGASQPSRHADDLAVDPDHVATSPAPGPSAESRSGVRFDQEQLAEISAAPVEFPPAQTAHPLVSPAKPVADVDPDWKPELDPVLRGEVSPHANAGGHGASAQERQLYEDAELGQPMRGQGRPGSIGGAGSKGGSTGGAVPIGGTVPGGNGLVVSLDGPVANQPVVARRPSTSTARVNEILEAARTTIRVAVRNGQTDAHITLRPAELGTVNITLRYENGGVSAMLTADTAQAFEALAQAASDLRRGLEQQGVNVLGLEVRLGGDDAQGDSNFWQDGTPGAESPFDGFFGEDEPQNQPGDEDEPDETSGGIDVFA
jgi:flagellar hook-length control protein FliK